MYLPRSISPLGNKCDNPSVRKTYFIINHMWVLLRWVVDNYWLQNVSCSYVTGSLTWKSDLSFHEPETFFFLIPIWYCCQLACETAVLEQRASRSRLLIWNPVTIFYHLKHDLYWVKVQFCSWVTTYRWRKIIKVQCLFNALNHGRPTHYMHM